MTNDSVGGTEQKGTPTVEESMRFIKKMEACEGMAAKLILLKNFLYRRQPLPPQSPTEPETHTSPVECGCDPEYSHHCPACGGTGYRAVRVTTPAPVAQSPTEPRHTNRHDEPCSKECGEGRHSECKQPYYEGCNCTCRGGHTVPHRYANIGDGSQVAQSPVPAEQQKCPKCDATNEEEASKVCSPIEGNCPIVEAGFWRGWPTTQQWDDAMRADAIRELVQCGPTQDMPTDDDIKHGSGALLRWRDD